MGNLLYRDFIIEPNDYPHSTLIYMYYHKDDTDGNCGFGTTIEACKQYIDEKIDG